MARRFSAKNTKLGSSTLFSAAHSLGKTPDEWAINLRHVTQFGGRQSVTTSGAKISVAYLKGVSTSNIRVRVATMTTTAFPTATGDVFAWVNHSIVK